MPPNGRAGSSHRLGAGRQQHVLGADDLRAGVGLDRGRSCRRASWPSPARSCTRCLLQQRADAAGQAVDDAVLPCDGAGRSRWLGRSTVMPNGADVACIGGAGRILGGVDQRLRRDAADVQAGAAEAVAASRPARCRCRAGRRGWPRHSRRGRRRRPAAWSVRSAHAHPSMKTVAGASSRPLMRWMKRAAS